MSKTVPYPLLYRIRAHFATTHDAIVPQGISRIPQGLISHTRRGRSYLPVPLLRRADDIRPYGPLVQACAPLPSPPRRRWRSVSEPDEVDTEKSETLFADDRTNAAHSLPCTPHQSLRDSFPRGGSQEPHPCLLLCGRGDERRKSREQSPSQPAAARAKSQASATP